MLHPVEVDLAGALPAEDLLLGVAQVGVRRELAAELDQRVQVAEFPRSRHAVLTRNVDQNVFYVFCRFWKQDKWMR